jgi:acyl-CoA reductase-like NAD-dependent aldehyde dehydrogenase
VLQDRNPCNGEVLTEIAQADREDLDAAYAAAAREQPAWAAALPSRRASVMRRAALRAAGHRRVVALVGGRSLESCLDAARAHARPAAGHARQDRAARLMEELDGPRPVCAA